MATKSEKLLKRAENAIRRQQAIDEILDLCRDGRIKPLHALTALIESCRLDVLERFVDEQTH